MLEKQVNCVSKFWNYEYWHFSDFVFIYLKKKNFQVVWHLTFCPSFVFQANVVAGTTLPVSQEGLTSFIRCLWGKVNY